MNRHEQSIYCRYRKLGTNGLVIFERERTLLRQSCPTADLMLRNINAEFVEFLGQLRERNIRFGFISDDRGMNAGSYGQTEFETLSRLLDGLLNIRGAMPDFWIASRRVRIGSEAKKSPPGQPLQCLHADMILRAIEWYGVETTRTLYVGNGNPDRFPAEGADAMGIQFISPANHRAGQSPVFLKPRRPAQFTDTQLQRLGSEIMQMLGLAIDRTV